MKSSVKSCMRMDAVLAAEIRARWSSRGVVGSVVGLYRAAGSIPTAGKKSRLYALTHSSKADGKSPFGIPA